MRAPDVCAVVVLGAALWTAAPASQADDPFPRGASTPEFTDVVTRSTYVTMHDGVRVAVDVLLPAGLPPDRRLPAILKVTRYNRAAADGSIHRLDRFFVTRGYARVLVDERGSGASFDGPRYGRATLPDLRTIIEWVVAQSWSNGRLGAVGNSYEGTTAELVAATGHPAVRAVVPRFSDFDYYRYLFLPGGVRNTWFVTSASEFIGALDRGMGAKRVESDADGTLLRDALAQRPGDQYLQAVKTIEFTDDRLPGRDVTVADTSNVSLTNALERAQVPMLVWAGWLDAGTAQGSLERFRTVRVPQRVILGPWNHAATYDANPFRTETAAVEPPEAVQLEESLRFFDRYLKRDGERPEHRIHYYTMGEERWKSTTRWPVADIVAARWWLEDDGRLAFVKPWGSSNDDAVKTVTLDAAASSGVRTRWHTQLGGGDVVYDAASMKRTDLLRFRADPATVPLEITGAPSLRLRATFSHPDPTLFVYLWAELPDGTWRYLTEGQFRVLHRGGRNAWRTSGAEPPRYSFLRRDARAVTPGEVIDVEVPMWPTSVRLPQNSRLQLTIAGADREVFGYPTHGDHLTLTVKRGSALQLPVIR